MNIYTKDIPESLKQYLKHDFSILDGVDIGTFYAVLDSDNRTIIGFYSSEFGTPTGYTLDYHTQVFVENDESERIEYAVEAIIENGYYMGESTKADRIEHIKDYVREACDWRPMSNESIEAIFEALEEHYSYYI